MVRSTCSDELVDRREILERLEVLGDATQTGIVDGFFDLVGPLGFARYRQVVAQRPGEIDDVAGLVADVNIFAQQELGAGGHSIGQHGFALHLADGSHGKVQVVLLASVGVEQ